MSELFLVRHGQASFGMPDYDVLSAMGVEQARALGRFFSARNVVFDHAWSGTLRRHVTTAHGLFEGYGRALPLEHTPSLNEYDFDDLLDSASGDDGGVKTEARDRVAYRNELKRAFTLLTTRRLEHVAESWDSFSARVAGALALARGSKRQRVLVISSGGVIGTMMQQILKAPSVAAVDLCLQLANTSVCRVRFEESHGSMVSFNCTAHLDGPESAARTTYL